ncbi:MAG: apolipoprotein N-acyltransferase [Gammaproteobacteria bacterium]|nr:apolipoprotein N-acyltransferase [Gammaproteobacteria bacterium]
MALLAGALLPLAFAPLGWFLLAVLSPAILFLLSFRATPRQALLLGYSFGVGFFGVGVSWVAVSFYRFGSMGGVLSVAATLLFVLFLALFPALLTWVARRFFSALSPARYFMLLMPALWVLLEWVRGWILTGFPWLNLGYSQTDAPLGGLAPVLGVYGISWAVALTAGLLLTAWCEDGRRRVASLGGMVLLWAVAGLLWPVGWSEPHGRPITASLIQGNVPQNLKWRPEQRGQTIDLYTRLSREHWDSDMVIWPETALPAYFHQAQSFLQGLAREARDNGGATLLVGLPVMAETDNTRYYNGVVRVGTGDDEFPSQIYRKSHLVPFGEYIPLQSVLGKLLDILQVPMASFSRGAEVQPLLTLIDKKDASENEQHPVQKIAVSICYEDAFGEEVIRNLPAATLLVNVSNDAWFGDSFAPHQHLQMARMRSMETSRPMLRSTNNGVSAIIDHRGEVRASSPQFEVAVLNGEVQPRSGATPYVTLGNWPVLSCLLLVFLFCGTCLRRRQ